MAMLHGAVPAPGNLARDRLTKVFKFLKELNELRNPVPRDIGVLVPLLPLPQQLYDRTKDEITLSEVERIRL